MLLVCQMRYQRYVQHLHFSEVPYNYGGNGSMVRWVKVFVSSIHERISSKNFKSTLPQAMLRKRQEHPYVNLSKWVAYVIPSMTSLSLYLRLLTCLTMTLSSTQSHLSITPPNTRTRGLIMVKVWERIVRINGTITRTKGIKNFLVARVGKAK